MTTRLRRNGHPAVAHRTVDRLMRELGINGVRRCKRRRATIPAKDGKHPGDMINRDFTAPAQNLVWVADFTHCLT